jgi:ferritin
MLSKKMQDALNDQINAETYSAYLYLSMAGYFHEQGLDGFGSWMAVQVQEELFHVKKFFDFICDRDAKVVLAAIDAPPNTWGSPLEAFKDALAHEQLISGRIADLVDVARKEKDKAAEAFLQWFVNEQIEEEATAQRICGDLKIVGKDGGGLFMLDRELGARTFAPPAA